MSPSLLRSTPVPAHPNPSSKGKKGRGSCANGVTIGICWIMRFYGPSQEFRLWTSEYLQRKCSNWDAGYVVFEFLLLGVEGVRRSV